MLTDHHAKYLAFELLRRAPSDSIEKLAHAVSGAKVDLNPHQVDAALFAFRSPLSRGALLADEVGLGKTIEAGLVIAQKWAERRRHILVITPANLRKQWYQELTDKFFLPCTILEARSYNAAQRARNLDPFLVDGQIVLCSYQFAARKARDVRDVPWDLVVLDEAHRLRNVYKASNRTGALLRVALAGRFKLLLTATPLQNSLLELYGLVSLIDEQAFGDLQSFKDQFGPGSNGHSHEALKERLRPLCHRTLRRQVAAHISFTRRHAMLQEFTPGDDETTLYDMVSEYLRRDNLIALPRSQRSLITLVLRKLLASSTFAIAGAMKNMAERLRRRLQRESEGEPLQDTLAEDYEAFDPTADEWDEEEDAPLSLEDREALTREAEDLETFAELARTIDQNAKGEKLVVALELAFDKATSLGAAQKAIIFTESRRTQDYLWRRLEQGPHRGKIVLFSGDLGSGRPAEHSRRIYAEWLARHQGTERVTGSRTADMRSALVDWFRDDGRIMIATEAGAEGINLQFCSLIVNYDLPWNPQRIEQRIGRCHRYGQQHDVVVVNFVNQKNEADRRVYELLAQKFALFEGVFGASDEILGAIESGVEFEKRIADIYQRCRRTEEISAAFDELQRELSGQIDEAMRQTRHKLLEHFDDEVREKLKVAERDSRQFLGELERRLMELTAHELRDDARLEPAANDEPVQAFELLRLPAGAPEGLAPLGRYALPRRDGESYTWRIGHPLADFLLRKASLRQVAPTHWHLDLAGHRGKVSALQRLVGQSGWLAVSQISLEALDQIEDYLLFAAVTDAGEVLDEAAARRVLSVPVQEVALRDTVPEAELQAMLDVRIAEVRTRVNERNAKFYDAESEKLDAWADDLKLGLERELRELDRQIRDAKRESKQAATLEAKLSCQRQVKALEATRHAKRRSLFEAQDDVDRRREELIGLLEGKLELGAVLTPVLRVRWTMG